MVFQTHLDYSAWASDELLRAASQLPPGDLERDFGTADRSVLGTLGHIFAADRAWLSRVLGEAPPPYKVDRDLALLQSEWPALWARWKEWARGLTPESLQQTMSYRDMSGNPWTQPLWQIILHVVNHATHHREQVAGFLRVMGHAPPKLDLIHYYRQMARTTGSATS